LAELVYKQGQAGVNKASVTIVFDNEDEASSPVGYDQCKEVNVTRQVLIGGKSKYLINGRNSPAGQVANLFHSVQLNVNNPHFLIMQGEHLLCECAVVVVFSMSDSGLNICCSFTRTHHQGS
jgi:structural maintenance of chromosome 2